MATDMSGLPFPDSYVDGHGVKWTIIPVPSALGGNVHGSMLMASMDDSQPLQYVPAPADLGPSATWQGLQTQLQDFVNDNVPSVVVTASSSSGSGWLVFAVIALLLLGGDK